MAFVNVSGFRRALVAWYRKNGRDLPWRHTRDPYAILVSEFMLQQTQVATVLSYYKDWLDRFPNFATLARAPESDVLHAWQGLGYYARARNLRATAGQVVTRYGGRLPKSVSEMQKLPGVGKYTAHAVATFAFDQAVPVVEANSSRILARIFNLRMPIDTSRGLQMLWNRAASLMPKTKAGIYNSALLDLGALICLPRDPKCRICPVQRFCRARNPRSLPMKRSRVTTERLVESHALVLRGKRLLLTKSEQRWHDMWILPAVNGSAKNKRPIYRAFFPFTNHRVTLRVFRGGAPRLNSQCQRWFSRYELARIPIPSPHRRAINALLH